MQFIGIVIFTFPVGNENYILQPGNHRFKNSLG